MQVYFILAPKANVVKIGRSVDPDERLKALQTSNAERLEIVLLLPHRAPFEEDQLHWRFRKHHQQGEWFDYSTELRLFVARKRLDPLPEPEDDTALRANTEELDVDRYRYPKHDSKRARHPDLIEAGLVEEVCGDSRPAMRSLGYNALPEWNFNSCSQQYWHEKNHREVS